MRRPAPRPIAAALEALTREATPQTLLARAQACWPAVAGEAVAREATPVSERLGTLTLACRSASWTHELTLLSPDLLERLNAALATAPGGQLEALRFQTARAGHGLAPGPGGGDP